MFVPLFLPLLKNELLKTMLSLHPLAAMNGHGQLCPAVPPPAPFGAVIAAVNILDWKL